MFLNRMSTKLAMVGLSFTLPIATMLSLMIAAKQKDINFALQETLGNTYQKPLEELLENLSSHRIAAQRASFGDGEAAERLARIRGTIEQNLHELLKVDARIGRDLQFTTDGLGKRKREAFTARKLSKELNSFLNKESQNISDYNRFFVHIRTMITHAGDTSNLILDPDLDSYYLMDVSLLALPQVQERLQQIAVFVEDVHHAGRIDESQRIQASVHAAFLQEADIDRITLSSQTALNEDQNFYHVSPTMQKTLPLGLKLFNQSAAPIVQQLRALAQIQNPKTFDIERFRSGIDLALNNTYAYHYLCFDELSRLLQVRIGDVEADKKQALIWVTMSLAFSLLLFVTIATSLIRRVSRISQATRIIASGNLHARVGAQGGDELGLLARSFDQMSDNVERLNNEIAGKNADLQNVNQNLEKIVAERTMTINTILDNVKFGFLLLGRDLQLREGFSKSCQDLLGSKLRAGLKFRDIFQLQDHRNVALYETFIEQAFEDFLPDEMTLRQIPNRLRIGERILSIQASTVRAGGQVSLLLFTISDATNLEKAERENTKHKVLVRLLREIDAFRNFLDETRTRLTLIRKLLRAGEEAKVRAELHTIKGNTAAFDLSEIAILVHNIEDLSQIDLDSIALIEKEFEVFLEDNYEILQLTFSGDTHDTTLTIDQKHLDDIVVRIRETNSSEEMMSAVTDWVADMRYKPARVLIGALPEYGERLAKRLEKEVHIQVIGADTRMDPDIMRPIMHAMIHLVRNSIDHGLETPAEREVAHKPVQGSITIRCDVTPDAWVVSLVDDGRGIKVGQVAEKALKDGHVTDEELAAMSREERLKLVFLNGMSTSQNVTDISGRGIGMSAVHNAVEDSGGDISIASEEGRGTTIRLRIPRVRQSMYLKAS